LSSDLVAAIQDFAQTAEKSNPFRSEAFMTVVPFRPRSNGTRQGSSVSAQGQRSLQPPPGVKAVGIDLGTTNSVVSVFKEHLEQPDTLIYEEQSRLVPSVVHWTSENSVELVGRPALEAAQENISQLVRSTKRLMGLAKQTFVSNGREYTPEEAATSVLKYLAGHPALSSEISLHGKLWAVVTVPAHFDDAARLATVAAAEAAGINILRIVNEPTAAALAYSMLPDVRDLEKETLVVYDLGGGTFDVSVVEREGLIFNVLASEGDVQLGGDDLDTALAEHLVKSVQPELASKRIKPGSAAFKNLLLLAEDAKKKFQNQGSVHIHHENLDDAGAQIDLVLHRDVFESLAAPYIEKTLLLTERAVHAAKKRTKNISRILLVGGSTRVALVRKMLEQYFPDCMVDARLEPDLAVSWGASIQAAIILGLEPSTILVDVCSHSLGVGVAEDSRSIDENFKKIARKFGVLRPSSEDQLQLILGDKFEDFHRELRGLLRVAPIIHRNSPLPSMRSEFFNTLFDNQIAVQVIVVQGEGETVSENRLIGTFMFELQQPCPAGSKCEIQLTYDQNGMVHVLAKQLGTENQGEAVFDSRTGEVKGWIALADDAEHEPSVGYSASVSEPQFTADSASSSAPSSTQVNATLVRARRHLMRLSSSSEGHHKLTQLIAEYEKNLALSAAGEDCDDALDSIEEQFRLIFEA
jgi:molecular chaperone DnaK